MPGRCLRTGNVRAGRCLRIGNVRARRNPEKAMERNGC